jgi:hypothetical protein
LAFNENIDFINARNLKNFEKSSNEIMTARESIEYLEMASE